MQKNVQRPIGLKTLRYLQALVPEDEPLLKTAAQPSIVGEDAVGLAAVVSINRYQGQGKSKPPILSLRGGSPQAVAQRPHGPLGCPRGEHLSKRCTRWMPKGEL
jgi:hypothetical protein